MREEAQPPTRGSLPLDPPILAQRSVGAWTAGMGPLIACSREIDLQSCTLQARMSWQPCPTLKLPCPSIRLPGVGSPLEAALLPSSPPHQIKEQASPGRDVQGAAPRWSVVMPYPCTSCASSIASVIGPLHLPRRALRAITYSELAASTPNPELCRPSARHPGHQESGGSRGGRDGGPRPC